MSRSLDHLGNGSPEISALLSSLDHARLLVVDDEENLRITTAAILEKEGYAVDTASSGNEAISLLTTAVSDLVLPTLHLKAGEGFGVLTEIRRNARLTSSVLLRG